MGLSSERAVSRGLALTGDLDFSKRAPYYEEPSRGLQKRGGVWSCDIVQCAEEVRKSGKERQEGFEKHMSDLVVRRVDGKGRGVFAGRRYRKGDVIESAPVIVLSEDPWEVLNQTTLGSYYFSWGRAACAVALGFGSLYNHSDFPNSEAVKQVDSASIEFVALRDIEVGEEITHRYQCPVWFEVRA